jgi:hypothetical protein
MRYQRSLIAHFVGDWMGNVACVNTAALLSRLVPAFDEHHPAHLRPTP